MKECRIKNEAGMIRSELRKSSLLGITDAILRIQKKEALKILMYFCVYIISVLLKLTGHYVILE